MRVERLTRRTHCRFRKTDKGHPDACFLRSNFSKMEGKEKLRAIDLHDECVASERGPDIIPIDCPLWEGLKIYAVEQGNRVRFLDPDELAKL